MPSLPTLQALLDAGCHFGHRTQRWEPRMAPYIFGERGGIHIINLEETRTKLAAALDVVRTLGSKNSMLLFVGTKPQARTAVQAAAELTGQPAVFERWLGGTFTNFSIITKLVRRLTDQERAIESGEVRRYTKYEQGKINEDVRRLNKLVGGIRTMNRLPDAVFVIGMREEATAIREATRKRIPIIAICDSNNNPAAITYPIPANDDGVKSITLITRLVAEAYCEGRTRGKKAAADAAAVATEAPSAPDTDAVTLTTMEQVTELVDVPPSFVKDIDKAE